VLGLKACEERHFEPKKNSDAHHWLSPVWVFAPTKESKKEQSSFEKIKDKWQWTGLFFPECVRVYVRPLPLPK